MLSAAGAGGGRGGGVPSSVSAASKAKQKKRQEYLETETDSQDFQVNYQDGLPDQNSYYYANNKDDSQVLR